jgi:hypothetical protein
MCERAEDGRELPLLVVSHPDSGELGGVAKEESDRRLGAASGAALGLLGEEENE